MSYFKVVVAAQLTGFYRDGVPNAVVQITARRLNELGALRLTLDYAAIERGSSFEAGGLYLRSYWTMLYVIETDKDINDVHEVVERAYGRTGLPFSVVEAVELSAQEAVSLVKETQETQPLYDISDWFC